jgi:F0F1-type ATP synthase membrane subunit b/b'
MEIIVKHEFTMSPELASFFSRILAPMHTETPAPAKAAKKEVKQVAEPIEETVQAVEPVKEEAKETVKVTASDITVEQLRAVVSQKASAGSPEVSKKKREELKKLLSTFGAENVTTLDKSKYGEFLTAVKAL